RQLRSGERGPAYDRDRAAFAHLFDLFELDILRNLGETRTNADDSMREAADAARRHNDTLPNADFYIHEASPVAKGLGKNVVVEHIEQFPGERLVEMGDPSGGDGKADAAVPPAPAPAKKQAK
ncbi:MAG: hypothetical protein R3247_17295, partial [Rhodothermales bacterium]|nr:hypothetical protein [Rhodothermales bacterium]